MAEKKNINVFNRDVETNKGYKYSTNAPLSSILANRRMTRAIVSLISEDIKTIIDIGCGDGTYTNEIKKNKPQLKITGTDAAETALKIAREKYPDIEFTFSNVLDKSTFSNSKYDLAVLRGVLHHLPEQEPALRNISECSEQLIIVEPNGNNPILKLIEKRSAYHIEHEEQSFNTTLLKKWCVNSGWNVEHVSYIGFVPMFFPALFTRIIYFFQPLLEIIPIIRKYFSAQIVIYCTKQKNG